MITRTIVTTRNIARLAKVIGSMARIIRSWDKSDDARAINSPVDVESWKLNSIRWMWVKIRFLMSASARYDNLNPKYRRMAMPIAWMTPAMINPMNNGPSCDESPLTAKSTIAPTRYGIATTDTIHTIAPAMDIAAMSL